MKKLGTVWICNCIIVAFLEVSVDGSVVPYPGRPALLSYSPARGEFPVASLFGRGFFSYIDGSGNSKIISLEPNPLQGVRIDSEGRPLLDIELKDTTRKELCEKQDYQRKLDKLKPIKEFDERPFQDSAAEEDLKLPLPDLPTEEIMEQEVEGQTKQLFVVLSDLPGFSAAARGPPRDQKANLELQDTKGPLSEAPAVTQLTPTTSQPMQGEPLLKLSYLPPPEPVEENSKLNLSYLPPKKTSKPMFLNPENPFLPQNTNFIPATQATLITSTPSTTSKPEVSNQFSPSTTSAMATTPTFRPQTASSTTNAFPSFAPGNPFLPATTVSPNPSSPSTAVVPNMQSPTSTVFQNPPPPPTPKPPSKNPFLSGGKPTKPRPVGENSPPQFNADKMNPFLPNIASTSPQLTVSAGPLQPPALGIPLQVKDTPEVEQAKREHFLAHQMALAQLQLAQQQGASGDKLDETSSASSPLSPCSHQAVTSGRSSIVAPEPTEDTHPTTDAVSLLAKNE